MNNYKEYDLIYENIQINNFEDLISIFAYKKDLMVLHSAKTMSDYGRYSFIAFDAFASFIAKNKEFFWNNNKINLKNPFDFIKKKLSLYKIHKNPNLPDFQCGALGYFGYEASHYLEKLPKIMDNIGLPDIYLNFYSSVIVHDHKLDKCWIIATGLPEKNDKIRIEKAKQKIAEIKQAIYNSEVIKPVSSEKIIANILSNFTKKHYIKNVLKIKEYILNGDIFQANISQQFHGNFQKNPDILALYFKLIKINPAPFAALLKLPNNQYLISASPERFMKLSSKHVETCPIKGTRKRSDNKEEDALLAKALASSAKDKAENIMIVDLMRNDLSKVCELGSIKVDELCALKSFETVHHLVSKIQGFLKNNLDSIDLLKAVFPPGSITGAPKIRAMEIIGELENQNRGPYCGVIGYLSFTGDMDTSVIIRTYAINQEKIFFSAGGAVVLDSDPLEEYQESLTKAKALIEALS